jgi:hypothetical protein
MMQFSLSGVQDLPAADTRGARSRRRQTLNRLPEEILENIFLEDVLHHKDLCGLALVSRRISRLAQVSLYHQVTFSPVDPSLYNKVPKSNLNSEMKYQCFKRTLLKNPDLGSYVWKTQLNGKLLEKKNGFRTAQQLLELLPALRALELVEIKCSDEVTCLFDIPMPHLRYISFSNDGMSSSIHEVTKAISFPKVKRLRINLEGAWEHKELEWTHQGTALSALTGKSSLKDLTVHWWVDSLIDDSDLLKVPRALEKLTCSFIYSGDLSPNGYIGALRPVYSTLVFLELSYYDVLEELTGVPGADFSCFTCLKTLIVDDALCFERWSSDRPDERSGFYNRLPFTLKVLTVSAMNVSLFVWF